MRLNLHTDGIEVNDDLTGLVDQRVEAALSRFKAHLGDVDVRLGDVNGPKGGIDKLCTLTITVRNGADVRIEEEAETIEAALTKAASRAKTVVGQRVDKLTSHR